MNRHYGEYASIPAVIVWGCKMYSDPIASFLTFTVRGSWRHGDSRGSWKWEGEFIAPKSQVLTQTNKSPPHFFSEAEQAEIKNAIFEQCELNNWTLYEIAVEHNHVHVVLTASDGSPETVMKLLKSRATFRLRQQGFVRKDEKIWTQHGSTKYLFDENSLETVRQYVRNHNPLQ